MGGIPGRPLELNLKDSESAGDDAVTLTARRLLDRNDGEVLIGRKPEDGAVWPIATADRGVISMRANVIVLYHEAFNDNPDGQWGDLQMDSPEFICGFACLSLILPRSSRSVMRSLSNSRERTR